jgi:hypothetical protein
MAFVLFSRALNAATMFFTRSTRVNYRPVDDSTQTFLYTAYLR